MAITSSILDALTRSLGSAAFAKAAATYRESEPAVTKAFTVAVASVLAPLVARAGDDRISNSSASSMRRIPRPAGCRPIWAFGCTSTASSKQGI